MTQSACATTSGLWSQPVFGRVNISCQGLMQDPKGRLGVSRAYKSSMHPHFSCLFAITYVCVWQNVV